MLGLGVDRAGKMAMIMGTSFVQLCFSEQKLQLDGLWGPYDAPIIPDAWLLEGGQTSAGSIVNGTCVSLAWTKWTTPTPI